MLPIVTRSEIDWLFRDASIKDVDFEDVKPKRRKRKKKRKKVTVSNSNTLFRLHIALFFTLPAAVVFAALSILGVLPDEFAWFGIIVLYLNMYTYWVLKHFFNGSFTIEK